MSHAQTARVMACLGHYLFLYIYLQITIFGEGIYFFSIFLLFLVQSYIFMLDITRKIV